MSRVRAFLIFFSIKGPVWLIYIHRRKQSCVVISICPRQMSPRPRILHFYFTGLTWEKSHLVSDQYLLANLSQGFCMCEYLSHLNDSSPGTPYDIAHRGRHHVSGQVCVDFWVLPHILLLFTPTSGSRARRCVTVCFPGRSGEIRSAVEMG